MQNCIYCFQNQAKVTGVQLQSKIKWLAFKRLLDHEKSRAANGTNEIFFAPWTPGETGTFVVIPPVTFITANPKFLLAIYAFLSTREAVIKILIFIRDIGDRFRHFLLLLLLALCLLLCLSLLQKTKNAVIGQGVSSGMNVYTSPFSLGRFLLRS